MIVDNWSIPQVLYIEYLEVVTGKQLINHSLEQSGDPRFDSLRFIISDWSQVKKTEIDPKEVKELIACLTPMAKLCPSARNASIVKRTHTGLALAAWYRHLGSAISWDIDIFHSPQEAFSEYRLDYNQLMQCERRHA